MFDKSSARRIVDHVRRGERQPRQTPTRYPSSSVQYPFVSAVVKVTSVPASVQGKYEGELWWSQTGTGPTFEFYNLAEVASGNKLLAVDDIVEVVRVPKAQLENHLSITISDSNGQKSWACFAWTLGVKDDGSEVRPVQRITFEDDSVTDDSNGNVSVKFFTKISKDGAGAVGPRKTHNYTDTGGAVVTVSDDAGNDEVDVDIDTSGVGGGDGGKMLVFEIENPNTGITTQTIDNTRDYRHAVCKMHCLADGEHNSADFGATSSSENSSFAAFLHHRTGESTASNPTYFMQVLGGEGYAYFATTTGALVVRWQWAGTGKTFLIVTFGEDG